MAAEFWDHLSLLKKLYDRSLEPVCEAFGLARTEMDILLFLANNAEFDTATDIVEHRGIAKSHVSMSVRRLEALGMLKGEFYPDNRKTVHLKLLPPSAKAVDAGQAAQRLFWSTLFHGLTVQESQQVKNVFEKVMSNARAAEIGGERND